MRKLPKDKKHNVLEVDCSQPGNTIVAAIKASQFIDKICFIRGRMGLTLKVLTLQFKNG